MTNILPITIRGNIADTTKLASKNNFTSLNFCIAKLSN